MILIDTGMPEEFDKFSSVLEDLEIDPKEIKAVIITHTHWDHIGCAKMVRDLTGAIVIVQKYEWNIVYP
jgi:glyoxylase-like metal-dependent hydrolase (beta-lactamase superfamily II)